MWPSVFLGAALSLGQSATTGASLPPSSAPRSALFGSPSADADSSVRLAQAPTAAAPATPEPVNITAPLLPTPVAPPAPAAPAPPAAPLPDRWLIMRELQGTGLGAALDQNRMALWGWTQMSYTQSTTEVFNQPLVWNDRADSFLLQQHFIRFERTVVTSGTTEPTFGFRIDTLIGSDYRFTLPRGLFNSQLQRADNDGVGDPRFQNIYGVDLVEHYVEAYVPNWFRGTDIKIGRFYTPFGTESIEAVSTPYLSRSYTFNWAPPFTHCGILATSILTPIWTVQYGLVNGNDVYFGDPAEELRFLGTVKYTSPNARDVVTFGTSVGRGKFNAGAPFFPATLGTAFEPAGRNNFNVFDLVWTHTFNPRIAYGLEMIYGYQTNVPANVPGGIIKEDALEGTAHWGSIAQYFTYTVTPRMIAQARVELFDDFEGQRTGFEGLYTSVTTGLVFKPYKMLWVRPELRYDYNGYNTPFEGKHDIFTAATDVVIRW